MQIYKSVAKWALKRRLPALTKDECRRTEALQQRVAALSGLDCLVTESAAMTEWINYRKRLRELVLYDDPRRFLQWDVIRNTMFLGSPPYIAGELGSLRSSPRWRDRWRRALHEDAIGLPDRCRFYLRSSGNLIHHAYSLSRFEQTVGRTIDQFQYILEFGGGYGSFCRLVHRLGFRGTYIIYDLPEFSALQEYFLSSVGVPLKGASSGPGVECVTDLASLEKCMGGTADWLFVGLWSLSETPVELRHEIFGDGSRLRAYLIGYQERFGEVDNKAFFSSWRIAQSQVNWVSSSIEHMPGNYYLLGLESSNRS